MLLSTVIKYGYYVRENKLDGKDSWDLMKKMIGESGININFKWSDISIEKDWYYRRRS